MTKPTDGWPRLSSAAFYNDAGQAIDWLVRAFGFQVRLRIEGEAGRIEHSELTFGDGLLMVGNAGGKSSRQVPLPCASPASLGGVNTQSICVLVDDVDAHCERARAAGATIVEEPSTIDHGAGYAVDRSYLAVDLEGHRWCFMQRLRGPVAQQR